MPELNVDSAIRRTSYSLIGKVMNSGENHGYAVINYGASIAGLTRQVSGANTTRGLLRKKKTECNDEVLILDFVSCSSTWPSFSTGRSFLPL